MSAYGIVFAGLVMHIGDDDDPDGPKSHLAMPQVDDHEIWISFGRHDSVLLSGVRHIVIGGVPAAPAAQSERFQQLVPRVRTIMGGFLERGARERTSNDATFMQYVGGTLHAGRPYRRPARHIRTDADGRTVVVRNDFVAGLTAVVFETDETVTITAGDALPPRVLAPDSFIAIGNYDRTPHDDPNDPVRTDPHFRRYARLTNFSNANIIIAEDPNRLATAAADLNLGLQIPSWFAQEILAELGILTVVHSECGNSAWP